MEKIQIDKNEELGSVLIKLESSKENEIVFSIAEGAIMLQSVINLKILKKRAEELGKSVVIERSKYETAAAPGGAAVPGREMRGSASKDVEVRVEKDLPASIEKSSGDFRKQDKKMEVSSSSGRVKMFDIVKKINSPVSILRPEAPSGVYEKKEEKKSVEEKNYSPLARYAPQDSGTSRPARIDREVPKTNKKNIRIPSIMSKIFYIFVFIVIALALVSAYMTLPKVNIDIKLKSDLKEYDLSLKVDEAATNIDADRGIIPAKKEEVNSEISESYPTTGKKHIVSKASGKITIYNEYSSNNQNIVATTRFLSKDGHMFRVEDNVTIPGFTRVEGKDVPGEVTVNVVADKAGEEFNIGATSFTIPGYQGGMKYSTIYGRSSAPMTGGADREAMYFSESDYITAKEKLVKEVREKNDLDMSGKNVDPFIILDGTRKEEDVKIITDVKVGDIADKFKMTVSIKDIGLFVSKDNINEIVDWKIKSETGEDVEVLGDRTYSDNLTVIKNEDGTTTLPIKVSQNVVAKIDIDKVKRDIYGKSEEGVRTYFAGIKEFKSVNVTFSWTKNVPSSNDKITVTIEK